MASPERIDIKLLEGFSKVPDSPLYYDDAEGVYKIRHAYSENGSKKVVEIPLFFSPTTGEKIDSISTKKDEAIPRHVLYWIKVLHPLGIDAIKENWCWEKEVLESPSRGVFAVICSSDFLKPYVLHFEKKSDGKLSATFYKKEKEVSVEQ